MFIDEAKVTSQLTHSNIVQIYEFGELDENYYLSMEFVDGKNLRQILARSEELKRPIPLEHAVYMVSKICEGLDYAHRFRDKRLGTTLQIMHRDISPQNVLISFEGEVKLIDFGIAKTKAQDGKTKSGVLKGKFGYMSPEQASGDPMDQRTDIFSTGIILFEMLTHQRLFMSNNDLTTLKKIQEAKIPAPSLFNPDIPFELEEISLKALSKDPAKRYQTARDFHQDLSKFLHTLNPEFTASHVSIFIRSLFAADILDHKKHMNEVLLYLSQLDKAVPDEEAHVERSAVIPQKRKITSETQTKSQTLRESEQISNAQMSPEVNQTEEQYTSKVWLQLGLMGLAVLILSVLLLYMNKKTDDLVQADIAVPTEEPKPASEPTSENIHTPTPAVVRIVADREDNETSVLQKKEFGFLNIKTEPISDIYIDDIKIGTTPIIRYQISAGTHTVKALNTEFNLTAEKSIEIKSEDVKLLSEDDFIFHPIE